MDIFVFFSFARAKPQLQTRRTRPMLFHTVLNWNKACASTPIISVYKYLKRSPHRSQSAQPSFLLETLMFYPKNHEFFSKTNLSISFFFPLIAGNVELSKLLLMFAADVNTPSAGGLSPLCFAAIAGKEDVIDLLLSYGPTVGFGCCCCC